MRKAMTTRQPGITLTPAQRKLLRAARLKKKLSLREFAEQTGLSHAAIDRYESGTRSPSAESLRQWAGALGFAVEIGETKIYPIY